MAPAAEPATGVALDPCGCEGTAATAARRGNRPGLPALAYRIGDHGSFLARLRERLPIQEVPPGLPLGKEPLAGLTLDTGTGTGTGGGSGSGDATDAVLDAAATALDVLTFYAERIANEGFLRTATERRSLLELARAIGYELRPGVAASAYLAFTVEDAAGAPGVATVAAGTPVQSIPTAQGESPQTYETAADLDARAEWNALRPRAFAEQPLHTGAETVYLAGTALNLASGNLLLIVVPGAAAGDPLQRKVVALKAVAEEPELDRTRVDVDNPTPAPAPPPPPLPPLVFAPVTLALQPFTMQTVGDLVVGQAWRERDLDTFLKVQRWEARKLTVHVRHQAVQAATPAPPLPEAELGIFAFRERLGIFGASAPRWDSLPANQRFGEFVRKSDGTEEFKTGAYAKRNWDASPLLPVTIDSQEVPHAAGEDTLLLERTVPTLRRNAWVVLTSPTKNEPYRIVATGERAVSDFAISAKAAVVQVEVDPAANSLKSFTLRETTAHVDAQALTLARLPIAEPLHAGDSEIPLSGLVLGLTPGRPLILTGERDDLPGVVESEVLILVESVHANGATVLTFTTGLTAPYVRSTVTLNANVVLATHGETIGEILGSGDGARPNQSFQLRRPPLTFVSADTETGTQTTLSVRVDKVLWEEVSHLFGSPPDARRYVVRREDDGTTRIVVGDGVQGARFPSGLENVSARYRGGIGLGGQVGAGTLTLLPRRPFGIRDVANPLAAGGAADPESRDDARANAPLTVRTIERIVSLSDYEDFARAFAGVGKVQAVALRKGAARLVHLTVAAADGSDPPVNAPLLLNLEAAIRRFGDPWQRFTVEGFEPRFFRAEARLRLETPRYVAAEVLAEAAAALLGAFGFGRRRFGQPVTAAEVIATLQGVPGVVSVDLDALHLIAEGTDPAKLDEILPAEPARWQDPRPEAADLTILRSELLLISPIGADLSERSGPA